MGELQPAPPFAQLASPTELAGGGAAAGPLCVVVASTMSFEPREAQKGQSCHTQIKGRLLLPATTAAGFLALARSGG